MRAIALSLLLGLFAISAHGQPPSVFVEDLTWPEVRDAIAGGKGTALYYAGSTEQNGPHMAIGKHNFVARYVAGRIAEELGNALVYPVMPYAPTGDPRTGTGHMRFPGTVSVSHATFASVAREVALSALAAGFCNVVLMGDHGEGQDALKKVAEGLDREWAARGRRVVHVPDPYSPTAEQVREYLAQRGLTAGRHADLQDTSEVMFLDTEKKWIRREKLAIGTPGSGVDGDPRQASPGFGKVFLDFKVRNAVAAIQRRLGAPR